MRQLSLDELKNTVARDVEAILNTRIAHTENELATLPECQKSVLTYGLNDFAGLSLASHYDRAFICKSIQQAIARHEPRLQQVQVTFELNEQATNALRDPGAARRAPGRGAGEFRRDAAAFDAAVFGHARTRRKNAVNQAAERAGPPGGGSGPAGNIEVRGRRWKNCCRITSANYRFAALFARFRRTLSEDRGAARAVRRALRGSARRADDRVVRAARRAHQQEARRRLPGIHRSAAGSAVSALPAAVPSCSIAQFTPASPGQQTEPVVIDRGTELKSRPIRGVQCRFRTAYDVTLAPIRISEARYTPVALAPSATVLRRTRRA